MNLYKFHNKPESIHGHDRADMEIPSVYWKKYRGNKLSGIPNLVELKKREASIAKDSKLAYEYAHDIIRKPFPAGEDAIAKDGYQSFKYANDILHKRFPKGEPAIAKDPWNSLFYAVHVLHGRFKAGEHAIATKNIHTPFRYAKEVIKGRFPEGEAQINASPEYKNKYEKFIKGLK